MSPRFMHRVGPLAQRSSMCLAIPGRIVDIDASDAIAPVARVDYGGQQRPASLLYVPEARIGEFVIVHAGFASRRLSEAEANEAMALRREMLDAARREPDPQPDTDVRAES